jgi:hypothetical protein
MARAADVDLSIDDFQTIADKTPYLADLRCIFFPTIFSGMLNQLRVLDHQENT